MDNHVELIVSKSELPAVVCAQELLLIAKAYVELVRAMGINPSAAEAIVARAEGEAA